MQSLDLNPIKEKIETYPTNQINDKLEVLSKRVKINGNQVDSYISPRWNDAYVYRNLSEQLRPEFDINQLNTNFSDSGLHVLQRPSLSSFGDFLMVIWDE